MQIGGHKLVAMAMAWESYVGLMDRKGEIRSVTCPFTRVPGNMASNKLPSSNQGLVGSEKKQRVKPGKMLASQLL